MSRPPHTVRRLLALACASCAVLAAAPPGAARDAPASRPQAVSFPPDVPVARARAHLAAFQAIAEAHGGNRAHGEPGYAASLDYVQRLLEAAGYETRRTAFRHGGTTGWNLLAEWPRSRAERVLMAGAHLDSVAAGPGLNDNASGAAAVLEVALAVARADGLPGPRLRFAWWGAEEEGLVGSRAYVGALSGEERNELAGYLNMDMVASPNPGYFVYDDDPGIAAAFGEWFAGAGVRTEPATAVEGRSDHAVFAAAGVPVGGVFTGAGGTMSEEQAAQWDGEAGEPFDPCYHRACDNLPGPDLTALDRSVDALAHAVWRLGRVTHQNP